MIQRTLSVVAFLLFVGNSTDAEAQYVYNWNHPTPSAGQTVTVFVNVDIEGVETTRASSFELEFLKDGVVVSTAHFKKFAKGDPRSGYRCEADITAPPFNPLNPYYQLRFRLINADGEDIGEEEQDVFVGN